MLNYSLLAAETTRAGRKTRAGARAAARGFFFSQKNGDMILTPKVCPRLRRAHGAKSLLINASAVAELAGV